MSPIAAFAASDLVLCLATFGLPMPVSWFGAIHVGLTVASIILLRNDAPRGDGWNCLSLPIGAVLGPCGIIGLLMVRPWTKQRLRSNAKCIQDDPVMPLSIPASSAAMLTRILDSRLRFPSAEGAESIGNILRFGSFEGRCKALEATVRSFEPALSPLIAIALSDPDQSLRALAAATSAQSSAKLADRIAEFEATPTMDIDDQYDFAMLIFDHAQNNVLLSQPQRTSLRNKAKLHFIDILRNTQMNSKKSERIAAALVSLEPDISQQGPIIAGRKRGREIAVMAL